MTGGVNYPELGDVGDAKQFYPEGHELTHPSGYVYRQINGDWVVVRDPQGNPIS